MERMKIPHWAPPTHAAQIFRYAEQGSIKLLWISATNPAVSMPNPARIRKVLAQEELFVVVQDAFMTETAQYADVILPAAIWGEKTGTFTIVDRTVHLSDKAVEPPGDQQQHSTGRDARDDLGGDVGGRLLPGDAPPGGRAERDGRVEVAAGDVADGVGHGQDGQTEGQGDTDEADAELDVVGGVDDLGGEHGRAGAAEDEPEGAESLGAQAGGHRGRGRGGHG